MDNTQQKMMRWMMPIMFLFIMLNMPSGLTLYIFANTLLTIVQQQFINRMVPAGAQLVAKGKDVRQPRGDDASSKQRPKHRKRK
jgi:membrane protein insertase Oxa1/YidC/SpoIIIJ